MIRNGYRFSDKATLAKKDDHAGISRVNVSQTLDVADVNDPNAKALAVAASDGGNVSIAGEVSDVVSGLDAALFYAETAGSTLSDEQIADAAIGAANRAAIRQRAIDARLRQDQRREALTAETVRRLESTPESEAE